MGRPRSQYPPKTPAERQAKRRAIKAGTYYLSCTNVTPDVPDWTPAWAPPSRGPLPAPANETPALPAPQAMPDALPALQTTALARTSPGLLQSLALPSADDVESGDSLRLSLPPAVAARLQSLLDKHRAGKTLTAAERAEAEGLIDIAEYFSIQRMRRMIAA